MAEATALFGRKILVVEDEILIAEDIADLVRGNGGDVVGPVPSVEAALALIEQARPDGAILNARLRGEISSAVVAFLNELHVPFVLLTGYLPEMLPAVFRYAPTVLKPYDRQQLLVALAAAMRQTKSLAIAASILPFVAA